MLALMIGDDSIKIMSSLRRVKRSLSVQKGSVSVVTSGSPSITRRCGGNAHLIRRALHTLKSDSDTEIDYRALSMKASILAFQLFSPQ